MKPNLGLKHVNIVLGEIYSACRITENSAELAKKQYIQSGLKTVFTEFIDDCENKGLNKIYYSLIGNNKNFLELWRIMKLVFIICHVNTSVENGFSMNKDILANPLIGLQKSKNVVLFSLHILKNAWK